MFRDSVRFSDNYSNYIKIRDLIRSKVTLAKEEFSGTKLYGELIDVNNPEHLVAVLYTLYKDQELFHEPL